MSPALPPNRIHIASLPKSGKNIDLIAGVEELAELALATGTDSMAGLRANVIVEPWRLDGAYLSGTINAVVRQTCVVTLDPIETELAFQIGRYFVTGEDQSGKGEMFVDGELILDPEADDLPDTLTDGMIDVWNVLIEELNLQIDPYPRLDDLQQSEAAEEAVSSDTHKPFADLKALITEKKSQN
ncbi:MAG: DUF177 domain-containing protein [Pseudomonadota bacterium]